MYQMVLAAEIAMPRADSGSVKSLLVFIIIIIVIILVDAVLINCIEASSDRLVP